MKLTKVLDHTEGQKSMVQINSKLSYLIDKTHSNVNSVRDIADDLYGSNPDYFDGECSDEPFAVGTIEVVFITLQRLEESLNGLEEQIARLKEL